MLTDLFSSLDGMTSSYMWLTPIIFTIGVASNGTWSLSQKSWAVHTMASNWSLQKFNSSKLLLTGVMLTLLVQNFLGLAPFVYGVTTSLWVSSSVAVVLWGLLIFSGYTYNFKKSLAHLCPSGAPILLIPLLVIIESISILIRPLTLTVRLVANMSAGHIILALTASALSSGLNHLAVGFLGIIMIAYYLFEFFVSLIQAYIFTLLVSLYMAEHPSS